jgi:hypothetical protein
MRWHLLRKIVFLAIVFIGGAAFSFAQDVQEVLPENQTTPTQEIIPQTENITGAFPQAEGGQTEAAQAKPPTVTLPSFSYKTTKESIAGRALILSIGVFPFSYFYTGIVLDVMRFVSNNFDAAYAPWPFKSQNSVALTNSEMWLKLGISAGLSIGFGILSAIIK